MEVGALYKYFPNLTNKQKEQFVLLADLYKDWNLKINVVSRKDIDELYVRHVIHSLGIAKILKFLPGSKVIDVGTGGGFPGIPLAIYFPEVHFHLIDGRAKKIKVVNEVANALELSNVVGQAIRAEELKMRFDFITARAVTQLDRLTLWCERLMERQEQNAIPNGLIAFKGGDLTEELKSIKNYREVVDIFKYFPIPYFEEKRILYIQF